MRVPVVSRGRCDGGNLIGNILKGVRGIFGRVRSRSAMQSNGIEQIERDLRTGILLQESGSFDQAAEIYKAVIAKYPEAYGAHQLLATIEISREHYDLAEKSVRLALEIEPQSVECLNTFGTICLNSRSSATKRWKDYPMLRCLARPG